MGKRWFPILLVALLAGGAAYYYFWLHRAAPKIDVQTAVATRGDVRRVVATSGTVRALGTVEHLTVTPDLLQPLLAKAA